VKDKKYEFVVVGSGAGGVTLARELSNRGKEVLVIERGSEDQEIGSLQASFDVFDVNRFRVPKKSNEGVILWRALIPGGSTVVSCGNSTPCLEEELADLGINLEGEFAEVEEDTKSSPTEERLLSEGSRKIREAAQDLGYSMEPMPKFVDSVNCRKCGQCVFGCIRGAKWTALEYLDEAVEDGARVLYNTLIEEVLVDNARVKGVVGVGPEGKSEILADTVVLSAGGLGTPVILQNSGIEESGSGLFVDLLVNTYGVTEGVSQTHEPTMTLVDHEFHGDKRFILSPFINSSRMIRSIEAGPKEMTRSSRGLLGVMTKTADDPVGRVFPDGTVSKPVTEDDWSRLNEGASLAKKILIEAGADSKTIRVSNPQGAHPGGTAAIGEIVDEDLQTEIDGLFVCDGSVLPNAPGMPPIVTICALAKRLAKTLA